MNENNELKDKIWDYCSLHLDICNYINDRIKNETSIEISRIYLENSIPDSLITVKVYILEHESMKSLEEYADECTPVMESLGFRRTEDFDYLGIKYHDNTRLVYEMDV